MFWADVIAKDIKKRNLPLEWIDDMKTPSGRVHVGSLRGVVIHDLIYKCLLDLDVNTTYSYIFDDHDPMDGLPIYLDKEKFEPYLGKPLFQIPSPEKGYKNYGQFFAEEFKAVFNAIGCMPKIIWGSDLYLEGKMNDLIKICMDSAEEIKKIYEDVYKKTINGTVYPFQALCPKCGKISTTTVTKWDGEKIAFTCEISKVKWTNGCGYLGEMSPFSSKDKFVGKLPWKVEWPCVWKVVGITVEGAGKDHMTAGGSHDIAKEICKRVIKYSVPYPLAYEFFVLGKQKMSSSKGIGASSKEMLEILPPQLLRFLMVRTRIASEINFDLTNPNTIPTLFDEYQKAADAYFNKSDGDLSRMFELSQIGEIEKVPSIRFSALAQWVQMPNMQEEINKQGALEWAKYAKVWVDRFAPESEKFTIQKELPKIVDSLSSKQREYLKLVSERFEKSPNEIQLGLDLYQWIQQSMLTSKEAFAAIYAALIGKDHGPKAASLIRSLDKDFVKKRLQEAADFSNREEKEITQLAQFNRPDIFSISKSVKEKYPSVAIGVAVIKGVRIEKENKELEKEKKELLASLEGLTTEQIGDFPETKSYRKLYKEMGVDWHSRRPSPEALLRRVAQGKGLYSINTCVDAYNLIVMKHHVSVGAFDLDTIVMPTKLDIAKGGEKILLLGDTEETIYKAGEIAYFDQKGPFNLDFNYRDSKRTLVQENTKNLYINVDGIYDISPSKIEEVLKEVCDTIVRYCGGTIEVFGVVCNV